MKEAESSKEDTIIALARIGYVAVGGIVLGESAGLPMPGATTLVAAGALAASGKLSITAVCVIGALLTILGANIAYGVGARFGVSILTMPGPLLRHRLYVLEKGGPFVDRYGWLAVLVGRSLPLLRECAPLLVGSLKMPWRRFMLWTSVGGIAWALSHALLGYFVGTVVGTVRALELIALAEIALAVLAGALHIIRRRRLAAPGFAEADEPMRRETVE